MVPPPKEKAKELLAAFQSATSAMICVNEVIVYLNHIQDHYDDNFLELFKEYWNEVGEELYKL